MENTQFETCMKVADNPANGVSERTVASNMAIALQLKRIADSLEEYVDHNLRKNVPRTEVD